MQLKSQNPKAYVDFIKLDVNTLSEIEIKDSVNHQCEIIYPHREHLENSDNSNKITEDTKDLYLTSSHNGEESTSNLHDKDLEIQGSHEKKSKTKVQESKTVWKYYGIVLALLSTLFIALSTYLVKILKVKYGYHIYISIFWRFVGICMGSLPVFWYYKWYQEDKLQMMPSDESKRRNAIVFLIGRCILGTLGFVFQYMALTYIPLGDSSVIAYSSPVLVLLLGWCFLNEECGWFPSIIAGLTILGVALIARPSFIFNTTQLEMENEGDKYKGILLSLSAMVCAASTTISLRLARGIHFSVISLCFGIIGMIIGLILSFAFLNEFKVPKGLDEIGLFVVLGILSYLAQIGLTMALKYESPGPVSVIRSMNSVVLFALDGISGIVPHPLSICGALVVIMSVGLIGFRRWISFQPRNSKSVRYFGFILK